MNELEHLQKRLTDLEIFSMQLQQDYESLNSVVLAQQRELETWRAAFARLENRIDTLGDPEPPRDPLAERPPHY